MESNLFHLWFSNVYKFTMLLTKATGGPTSHAQKFMWTFISNWFWAWSMTVSSACIVSSPQLQFLALWLTFNDIHFCQWWRNGNDLRPFNDTIKLTCSQHAANSSNNKYVTRFTDVVKAMKLPLLTSVILVCRLLVFLFLFSMCFTNCGHSSIVIAHSAAMHTVNEPKVMIQPEWQRLMWNGHLTKCNAHLWTVAILLFFIRRRRYCCHCRCHRCQ